MGGNNWHNPSGNNIRNCWKWQNSKCWFHWSDGVTQGVECDGRGACEQGSQMVGGWHDCNNKKFYFTKKSNLCGWN